MEQNQQIELLKKIAKGDSKSFESLLRLHKDLVLGFCMRMMADPAKAEDMAQEVWMRVIRSAGDFQPRAKVSSWILTIAKNLCINELCRSSKTELLDQEAEEKLIDETQLVDEIIQQNWQAAQLKKCIDELPDMQRAVVVLMIQDDLSYAELAKELKISVNACKVLIFRARQSLQKIARKML